MSGDAELLSDIYTEADLCKNEQADDIADLLDRCAKRITRQDARTKELEAKLQVAREALEHYDDVAEAARKALEKIK